MEKLFLDVPMPKANVFSPNTLAYIGDCVYELHIRHLVLSSGNKPVQKIHNEVKSYVSAKGQVKLYEKIKDMLTEKEAMMFKKGRNSKVGSYSKNLELGEYKIATGLECLVGYLYVTGDIDRITELLLAGINRKEK